MTEIELLKARITNLEITLFRVLSATMDFQPPDVQRQLSEAGNDLYEARGELGANNKIVELIKLN